MRIRWSRPYTLSGVLVFMLSMFSSPLVFAGSTASGPEAAYLKENDVAMTRMMDAMSVDPTGDVDHDFVAMMIPHHQGAIDMAEAELRYGKNEQLRRIAQEIVIEQQQEIVAMHVALGQSQPPSSGSRGPTGGESNAAMGHAPVVGNDAMHMHGSQQMSTSEEK